MDIKTKIDNTETQFLIKLALVLIILLVGINLISTITSYLIKGVIYLAVAGGIGYLLLLYHNKYRN